MNQRLAVIDRIAEIIHDDRRRRYQHHAGATLGTDCVGCRDTATFIYDEIGPLLRVALSTQTANDEPQPLTVVKEIPA